MRTVEAAMQTLDAESSGELTRALEGIVGENKWTTLREEWPGFRAHLKEYKFLTRAQLWCEEADALDGAVRPGGEQARHMYYKGVISTTLDKAIKQAERKARETAKTAAVTRGEECTWQPRVRRYIGAVAVAVDATVRIGLRVRRKRAGGLAAKRAAFIQDLGSN